MKKLVMLVLAIAMLALPVMAMAKTLYVPGTVGAENNYASLGLALQNAQNGDIIKVTADIPNGAGEKISKSVTIDFGGHTYNFTTPTGSTGTVTLGFQVLKEAGNVTMVNGTLICTSGKGIKRLIQNYANLTLVDMVLDGRNLDEHAGESKGTPNITVAFNNGTSYIKGETTIISDDAGDGAFDVYDYATGGYNGVELTVETTGNIVGAVHVHGSNGNADDDAKLTIKKVGSGSKMNVIVDAGEANMGNLPGGTTIVNNGKGNVVANGTTIGKTEYMIPVPEVYNWDAPATGDTENLMMWVALLAMSFAGLAYMRKVREN